MDTTGKILLVSLGVAVIYFAFIKKAKAAVASAEDASSNEKTETEDEKNPIINNIINKRIASMRFKDPKSREEWRKNEYLNLLKKSIKELNELDGAKTQTTDFVKLPGGDRTKMSSNADGGYSWQS